MATTVKPTQIFQEEIEQYYHRNAIGVIVDNAMFSIISLGLSQYTILPLYLSKLTDSKILIGLIPTVYIVGFALPQLFVARFLKGKRRRKPYFVGVAVIQRLSILAFLLLTLVQTNLPPKLTIILFFLIFAIQNLLSGCWFPMWVDFVGRSIPRNRGLIFGLSTLIGGFISLAIGGLITYLLETLPYPSAISAAAAISFFSSLVSLVAIISWHETVPSEPNAVGDSAEVEGHFLQNIKTDKNYQNYLSWRGLITGIEMALPFLTVSAIERMNVPDSQVGIFATILSISLALTNLFWGWLGDRIGFLRIVLISTIFGCVGVFLAADALSLGMFYLVFICAGTMLSGQQLANINIIYEYSESDHVPAYAAVHQMVLSPISSIMPIVGGIVVDFLGYRVLFWLSSLLGMGGVIGMSVKVKDQFINLRKVPRQTYLE